MRAAAVCKTVAFPVNSCFILSSSDLFIDFGPTLILFRHAKWNGNKMWSHRICRIKNNLQNAQMMHLMWT